MVLPEGTKLRKGDVVAVHARVKFDFDPAEDRSVSLDLPGASYAFATIDEIASVVRRRFDTGETVKARIPSPYAGETLVVEAVSEDGKSLWLRRPGGAYATLGAGEVDLVEPEPKPEPAPEPPPAPENWDSKRSDREAAQ